MKTQPLTAVKIGNAFSNKTVDVSNPGSRTFKQWEAMRKYFALNPSAWWCLNVFEGEPEPKPRTILISYYSHEGRFTSVRITPTGRTTIAYASDTLDAAGEAAAVGESHGFFRG